MFLFKANTTVDNNRCSRDMELKICVHGYDTNKFWNHLQDIITWNCHSDATIEFKSNEWNMKIERVLENDAELHIILFDFSSRQTWVEALKTSRRLGKNCYLASWYETTCVKVEKDFYEWQVNDCPFIDQKCIDQPLFRMNLAEDVWEPILFKLELKYGKNLSDLFKLISNICWGE